MEKKPAGGWWGLVLGSVLMVVGSAGAWGQDERVLTVVQTAVQTVRPPVVSGASNPLDVVAWVDRADNTYATNERVRLFVQTNKDAYVTVLNVGPDGSTTVLFPNRFQSENRVRANTVTEVPDPSSQGGIAVTGMTGAELIKVIASGRPVPLFEATQLVQAGPYQTVRTGAEATARNLSVVMTSESSVEWDIYDKVIRTVPSRPQAAPASVAAVAGAGWPLQPFGLEMAADRSLYRLTDPVTLMVKSGVDCHLTLLNTGPGGRSRLLFPNRYQQQTLIRAGQTVVVPGVGAGVAIRPIGPAGVENVLAVCRTGDAPVLGVPDGFGSGAFPYLSDRGATARNLSVVGQQGSQQTATASVSFVVVQ